MRVERFARRLWAGELGRAGAVLSALALPASWTWSRLSRVRARRFARRGGVRVDGTRVVSVGNLAVGGTGKTPIVAWAARSIARAGVPTCVVVGDHGRDEGELHARWNPDIPVIVDRDRVAGVRRASVRGAGAVVLDDAFQHLRLERDLDIVLLSADDPFPGPVLPRGPYREPAAALARAHALVVTRRATGPEAARGLASKLRALAPGAVSAGVHLAPRGLTNLSVWAGADEPPRGGPDRSTGEAPSREGPALAVCGVARPTTFLRAVERLFGGPVELLAFPDHHVYGGADVERMRKRAGTRPLVLTAKDAVKLAAHGSLGDAFVLTEELRWEWGEEALASLLAPAAREVGSP